MHLFFLFLLNTKIGKISAETIFSGAQPLTNNWQYSTTDKMLDDYDLILMGIVAQNYEHISVFRPSSRAVSDSFSYTNTGDGASRSVLFQFKQSGHYLTEVKSKMSLNQTAWADYTGLYVFEIIGIKFLS